MRDPNDCCPVFDPAPWTDQVITWDRKLFLKDRVCSLFHIPLNFGAVTVRSMAVIEKANALPDDAIVLADENSLWGADVYISISKEIPGAHTAALSGTFLSKVYEGPFRKMRTWIADARASVQARGKTLKKLYFYYTTCPKCAKKYGKNYVVILAEV